MSATVNVSLSFEKSGISESFSSAQTATMSVAGYKVQAPTFGTAASQISTATLNTLGYAYLRSLVTTTQTTCTLTFGRLDGATLHPVVKLRPGEPAMLRLAAGNYAAQGAAEGYRLLVAILED